MEPRIKHAQREVKNAIEQLFSASMRLEGTRFESMANATLNNAKNLNTMLMNYMKKEK